MKIRKLIVENWCQHSYLEAEFSNGLTGILGHNGAGKSNLIRAMVFALTGYTEGPRGAYLRHGESYGRVSLEFVTDSGQEEFRVVRCVHGSGIYVERKVNGEYEQISSTPAEARAIVGELIHISPAVAQHVSCTSQEEMTAFLSATSSDRTRILQQVFSLQGFKRMRTKLKELVDAGDDRAKALETKLMLLREQEQQKRTFLAAFPTLPPRVALDTESKELTDELQEIARQLGSLQLKTYLLAELEKGTQERDAVREQLAAPFPVCEEERPREVLEEQKKQSEYHFQIAKQFVKLLTALLRLPVPEQPDDSDVNRLDLERARLMSEVTSTQAQFERIRGSGTTGTCPTCGSAIQWTEEDLRSAQEAFIQARQQLEWTREALQDARKKLTAQEKQCMVYENARQAVLIHMSENCIAEQPLTAELLAQWERGLTEYEQDIQRYADSISVRAQYDIQVQAWSETQQALSLRLEGLEKNLETIRSNPALLIPDTVDSPALEQRKAMLTQRLEEVRDLLLRRVQYDGVLLELEGLTADIASMERLVNTTQPELREHLHAVVDLFHEKQFPQHVAYSIYKVLTERLQFYLAEFDAPYTVTLEEDGDFICRFPDGMTQKAARLSGGEKMLLSVAFRLALHSVYATDDAGGFVMLDEPTTFLDSKNREALAAVLNRLRTSPVFSNLQIFVVTHDDMLRPLFDNVVDLG